MFVKKRNGRRETVHFDKITARIKKLCWGLHPLVDATVVAQKVCQGVYEGVTTVELDELSAETAAHLTLKHPDYGALAARILVSNLHKTTLKSFVDTMTVLHDYVEPKTQRKAPLICEPLYQWMLENRQALDSMIVHDRDNQFDFFGYKTLERSYLLKANRKIVERPQFLLMRVACAIHYPDLAAVRESYTHFSLFHFTHASPTLFNAGVPGGQLSSCFLLTMKEDSIEGIFETLKACAVISKNAGGIGLSVSNIRCSGAYIAGTNGTSNGLIPMLRCYNAAARYVDQGGGKRKGAFAIYLEPWYAEVEAWLDLGKKNGVEEERARDLFFALWIPDLFMKRVEANGEWTLMSPDECPGLTDVHSDEFDQLYCKYEAEGKGRKTMKARDLWQQIVDMQTASGMPYMLYKDAINRKSNQKNLGVIRSSNLCVAGETLILTDKGQLRIDSLKDQKVNTWNGNAWSPVLVAQTGVDQSLVRVKLSNGMRLDCTPYHKFLVDDNTQDGTAKPLKEATRCDAGMLKVGTRLVRFELPRMEGEKTEDFPHPYTHGFFCANGAIRHGFPRVALYGAKKAIVSHLAVRSISSKATAQGGLNLRLDPSLRGKFEVPINASRENKLQWFAGYVDGDGAIVHNRPCESLQIASVEVDFLSKVQLMLQTLGVQAKVRHPRDWPVVRLPDSCASRKTYKCESISRLSVCLAGLQQLVILGWSPKCLVLPVRANPRISPSRFVTVETVEHLQRKADTFCFTEDANHAGVFNGILTGQCAEIQQFSSPEEHAVCNLASLSLPAFANASTKLFDFERLLEVVKVATRNLNKVIDRTTYPLPEAKRSNLRHRPIGLGVQGLQDAMLKLRMPYDSDEAVQFNKDVFECIYFGALSASSELAERDGPYETYSDSPVSKGILQFDMWGIKPSERWDWAGLREKIKTHGVRNSLLTAPMPTASTSQILGNTESFEPLNSNIFVRRTLAGEFVCVNRYLLADLIKHELWTPELKNLLLAHKGSVQGLPVPDEMKRLYKTVWEIKQRHIVDMAADRGPFIDQSQSLNIHIEDPTTQKLTALHFHGWKKGLKTGSYYIRSQPAAPAIQFTVDQTMLRKTEKSLREDKVEAESKSRKRAFAGAEEADELELKKRSRSDAAADISFAPSSSSLLCSSKPCYVSSPISDSLAAGHSNPSSSPSACSLLSLAEGSQSAAVSPLTCLLSANTLSPPSSLLASPGEEDKEESVESKVDSHPPPGLSDSERAQWLEKRDLARERLLCSRENKGACLMCSS